MAGVDQQTNTCGRTSVNTKQNEKDRPSTSNLETTIKVHDEGRDSPNPPAGKQEDPVPAMAVYLNNVTPATARRTVTNSILYIPWLLVKQMKMSEVEIVPAARRLWIPRRKSSRI